MASVLKRGPYQWQVKIRRKGWPKQAKTFETHEEAMAWARMIENEMDRGIFMCRKEAESTTLHEALERYRKEVTPHKKGRKQEKSRINILQLSPLADRYLASIRGTDVARYRDSRLKDRRPSSVNNELILLSHLFSTARKEWGMEGLRNPVRDIRKPKQPSGRERRLLPGEEEKLLTALPSTIKPLVIFALETGMRRGELLTLDHKDVDFHQRIAKINESKNGTSRSIPLSKEAINTLKALPRNLSGKVFSLSPDYVSHTFRKSCIKAKLEDLRFHDLRHEATSRLFEKGLNTMEVSSITGHKTLQMLQRYTHLRAEDLVAKLG